MRLKHLSIKNFGSYKELELDLTNLGLTLIHGATGSGKSTILDAILWTLYGQTGKNTNADDVRGWSSGMENTYGELLVEETFSGTIRIVRVRSTRNCNDLFFSVVDGSPIRGKDLVDTQRLLTDRLGIDCDGFVGACYYNEFSSAGSFFTAKAKERREVFEQLGDLSLPRILAQRASTVRGEARQIHMVQCRDLHRSRGGYDAIQHQLDNNYLQSKLWEKNQEEKTKERKTKAQNFEQEKQHHIEEIEVQYKAWSESHRIKLNKEIGTLARLKDLADRSPDYDTMIKELKTASKCKECGELNARSNKQLIAYNEAKAMLEVTKNSIAASEEKIAALKDTGNPYQEKLAAAHNAENHYLGAADPFPNPFLATIADTEEKLRTTSAELTSVSATVKDLEHQISSLGTLMDLASSLRAEVLRSTVKQIEHKTNSYMEEYFDGELRVVFEAVEDDIEISVSKSGYPCGFKQLSKGQRQLLRLCFWLASREARCNHSGQSFNLLLLDEPSDGLDVDMKMKAHRLYEKLALEQESVLVVEHGTEAKSLFTNSFKATLDGDVSRLERE